MKRSLRDVLTFLGTMIALIIILFVMYIIFTPSGRALINNYAHLMKEVDDKTLYQTRKDVEDTCRSMQASYESDKLVWLQFKDSDNAEKQNWADAAMIRANKTAAEYNNYVLKNRYVWKDNIPADIYVTMQYLGMEEEVEK